MTTRSAFWITAQIGIELIVAQAATAQGLMFSGLGTLPGAGQNDARGISADGTTAVGVSGDIAFRWRSGTGIVSLGTRPVFATSLATAVSADGSVVVGTCGPGLSGALRWTEADGMRAIAPVSGSSWAVATGVSADGSVVTIKDMEPCDDRDDCPRYRPSGPYRYAIEVPQGDLTELGITESSTIRVGGSCAPRT